MEIEMFLGQEISLVEKCCYARTQWWYRIQFPNNYISQGIHKPASHSEIGTVCRAELDPSCPQDGQNQNHWLYSSDCSLATYSSATGRGMDGELTQWAWKVWVQPNSIGSSVMWCDWIRWWKKWAVSSSFWLSPSLLKHGKETARELKQRRIGPHRFCAESMPSRVF